MCFPVVVSGTLHALDLVPARPGTTDPEIQSYFDSGSDQPPPFLIDGPSVELPLRSPAKVVGFGWSLPPGTYIMFCFADDETGLPHAIMGMHKVVILR